MFKLLVPVTLALIAAAVPQGSGTTVIAQCNTGDVMCCNNMQDANSAVIGSILSGLGIDTGNLSASNGQVGLGCTAVGVNGTAQGASCAQQPVCCDGNTFNGILNFGCNPVSA